MLADGQDTALLRFSLGQAYFQADDLTRALPHLAAAVAHDGEYSAAWKVYGRALAAAGKADAAADAFRQGIHAASIRGDKQAVREMEVFLRRLERSGTSDPE
jgi:Tfp pilus assembly protein PilF